MGGRIHMINRNAIHDAPIGLLVWRRLEGARVRVGWIRRLLLNFGVLRFWVGFIDEQLRINHRRDVTSCCCSYCRHVGRRKCQGWRRIARTRRVKGKSCRLERSLTLTSVGFIENCEGKDGISNAKQEKLTFSVPLPALIVADRRVIGGI